MGNDSEATEQEMEQTARKEETNSAEDAAGEAESELDQSVGEESAVDDSASDGLAELESLREQLQEAKDQSLRAAAEMQNVRKRAERDVENAHKYGQEKLINALLPVLDNLDRAIEAVKKAGDDADASSGNESLLEGVELTRKSALGALQSFSVEVIEPYGEPFDPQLHEAMTMVPSDTAEPNSVIDVLQKGYSLNGRLLRAAMVVVAK